MKPLPANRIKNTRYSKSEDMLARAERSIPLGAQTFSKSRTQYPVGASPFFVTHAEGCRVWDVDGNEYIDLNNALAAITLGYNDPDVTAAVKEQLEKGTIFSLSNELEIEVAEKMIDMIPCAEKVRFGKNGSDATAGAIRIARAFTGRDLILSCGYHGWQDWYIGATTRNKGVPQAVRDLTHLFPYNDLEAAKKLFDLYKDQVAAIIMEPMNVSEPAPGYHEELKALAHKNGALFIFDETVTGFRLANGGAQEYFGVTPDLATFGKGMANGYPISAITGREDIMREMEEIFFSFTYGGELLSLAAANAVMKKLQKEPVLETMAKTGTILKDGVAELIAESGLSETLSVSGHPAWHFLIVKDHPNADSFKIKTYFIQEMMKQGILTLGAHDITYAHTEKDMQLCLAAYKEFLRNLAVNLKADTLDAALTCEPLRPLFKIR